MAGKVIIGTYATDVTCGQQKEVNRQMEDGSFTFRQVQDFLDRKNPFVSISADLRDQQKRWQVLFDGEDIACDVYGVSIPKKDSAYGRLIIVPKGLVIGDMIDILNIPVAVKVHTDDLEEEVVTSLRTNDDKSYAVWVKEQVEADDFIAENETGIDLLEMLLYFWVYHTETDKHLDVDRLTYCTGSMLESDRSVPSVYWEPDKKLLNIFFHEISSGNDVGRPTGLRRVIA